MVGSGMTISPRSLMPQAMLPLAKSSIGRGAVIVVYFLLYSRDVVVPARDLATVVDAEGLRKNRSGDVEAGEPTRVPHKAVDLAPWQRAVGVLRHASLKEAPTT